MLFYLGNNVVSGLPCCRSCLFCHLFILSTQLRAFFYDSQEDSFDFEEASERACFVVVLTPKEGF